MIRGAIDLLENSTIGGWLYSDVVPLKNHTVLAFVDDQCIGSGTIRGFRHDLFEAGLGDGYSGFSFEISVPSGRDAAVVVRLEGSDLSLLQKNSLVSHA